MIGLAIVLLLIVAYFASTTDIVKAYEESERIILEANQTPEQKSVIEALKEQWLADFNRLLNESNNGTSK
jgi:hypothetical protein